MTNFFYKLIFLICVFNLLFFKSIAQINTNDLGKYNQDTNLVNRLNADILIYKNLDPKRALTIARKSVKLSTQLNFERGLFTSLICMVDIYYIIGEKDSATIALNFAEAISKKINSKTINAQLLLYKGNLFVNKNKLDSAILYNIKSLKLYSDLKDTAKIIVLFTRLGSISQRSKLNKDADNYYKQALAFIPHIKDSFAKSNTYAFVALAYFDAKKIDSELFYNHLSLGLCPKNNLILKNLIVANFGSFFFETQNNDSALVYFKKAYTIAKTLNLKNRLLYLSINIASLLNETNKLDEAEKLALEILPISKSSNDYSPTSVLLEILSNIYAKKNNYSLALNYYKESVIYKDSLQQQGNRKQVLDISAQYETEKKDAQINLLNKDKELSIKEAQKQRYIKIFISSVALFLIVLAGFLFYNFRQKNKSNKLLSLQKQQIENKNEQLETQKNNIELQNTLLGTKNQLITDSIEYARKIQDSMLPDKTILFNYFSDAFIYYQPKDIVSGDFYWLKESETGIVVALADCTGHGVPGALMSVLGHNSLDSAYSQLTDLSPANVVRYLNGYMKQKTHHSNSKSDTVDGMALSLIDYNKHTHKIHYTTANHYIYIVRNKELIELKGNSFSIGSWQTQEIVEGTLQLEKNDMLYLFSDGYADQKGEEQKRKFMYMRLKELLLQKANLNGTEQHMALKTTMDKWKGNLAQIDDILVVGIRV